MSLLRLISDWRGPLIVMMVWIAVRSGGRLPPHQTATSSPHILLENLPALEPSTQLNLNKNHFETKENNEVQKKDLKIEIPILIHKDKISVSATTAETELKPLQRPPPPPPPPPPPMSIPPQEAINQGEEATIVDPNRKLIRGRRRRGIPSDFADQSNSDFLTATSSPAFKTTVTQMSISNSSMTQVDCRMEKFFCKAPSESCGKLRVFRGGKGACVKPLFVTGTSGSGTHYVAHFLSKISRRGITVKHESPATAPDVLVSWPSRCPESKTLNFGALGISNDRKDQKPPMVAWANSQLNGRCSYKAVVHLVRHPLKFLSSNFAFGQCLECWALVEHLSMPPIKDRTAEVRKAVVMNRRKLYDQSGGRVWDKNMRKTLLKAFMLYWVNWNQSIEKVANERVRVEDMDLRAICLKYNLGNSNECNRPVAEEKVRKVSHGGDSDSVSWSELENIDSDLTGQVWDLAQSYGYNRDPPAKKN